MRISGAPCLADLLDKRRAGLDGTPIIAGRFGTRKLHTDSEEMLFNATKPCLLNGIPDLANRPDLADRSIIITLPAITNTERQTESEFWNAFNKAAPRILAGLLDAVLGALANIHSVRLSTKGGKRSFAATR